MATAETTPQVNTADNQSQNEYIIIVNKRIRALKKKISNVEYIEAKVAKNEKINAEQQQLYQSKDYMQKSLAELEQMRNQFVAVFEKEQKEPKAPKEEVVQPQTKEPEPVVVPAAQAAAQPTYNRTSDLRQVLSILYASQLFDRNRPEGVDARKSFFSEQESQPNRQFVAKNDSIIDSIFYLVNFIFNSPPNAIDSAVEGAEKFLNESSDDFSGVPYKTLYQIVSELVESNVFKGVEAQEEPTQVETQEEVVEEQPQAEEPQQQQQEEETVTEEPATQESQEQTEDNKQRFSGGRGYRGRGGRGGGRARGGPRPDRGSDRGGRGGSFEGRGRGGQRGGPRPDRGADRGSPRGGRKETKQ